MKLRSERDILVEALSAAARATAGRSNAGLPVLSGLRIELEGDVMAVTGTDLDLTIVVRADVAGREDGTVVAPGRLLTEVVRALDPGAVELETVEEDLIISSGRSTFSVRTHLAADFPRINSAAAEAVTLPAEGLAESLRQVVRAASSEDHRPILTGVLMAAEDQGLRLVATDSYRLAVKDVSGAGVLSEDQKVLVPSRALGELSRLLSGADQVTLRLGTHDATFSVGRIDLTTRLIEGEFPNYRRLIPSDYTNKLTVAREPFADAVRRVKLLAREPNTPVRIELGSELIKLSAITNDWGTASEEVDAAYQGSPMTVAFNPGYLLEGIEAVGGENVILSVLDPMKPATLTPAESNEYLYLIMPMRIS